MVKFQDQNLKLSQTDALIIVDVQNDFLSGGSLAVPHGDEVIAPLNQYIHKFQSRALPVIATRDWHPQNHCSFRAQGGIWPSHCVRESSGAQISTSLNLSDAAKLISKGILVDRDAYSGFQDTKLDSYLSKLGVKRLFIGGLATDYCVLNTVLDALDHHFFVCLLSDAVHAVNVKPDDGVNAMEKMRKAGAQAITLDFLL